MLTFTLPRNSIYGDMGICYTHPSISLEWALGYLRQHHSIDCLMINAKVCNLIDNITILF